MLKFSFDKESISGIYELNHNYMQDTERAHREECFKILKLTKKREYTFYALAMRLRGKKTKMYSLFS